jgi:fucose permease
MLLARSSTGPLLARGCFTLGLGVTGWAVANAFGLVPLCAAIAGLGAGAIDAGVNAFVAKEYGARMLNWMHAAYGLGAALGPIIMTALLSSAYSWRMGYGLVGGAAFLLGIVFVSSRGAWSRGVAGVRTSRAGAPLGDTLRLGRTWLGIVAFFIYTGLEAVAGVWAYSFLTTVRELSMGTAGTGVAAFWAALSAGRVTFGTFVDPDAIPGMLRLALRGLVAAAVSIAIPLSAGAAIFGFALLGFAAGPVFPSLMAGTVGRMGDEHSGNAIGFQVAAAALGQSLLPAVMGIAARRFGLDLLGPFLIVAAVALLAVHTRLKDASRCLEQAIQ